MNITEEHQAIVQEAEALAEEEFSGTETTIELRLWDDGDFCVEVTHGRKSDGVREKIVWRSSKSHLFPAETFVYLEDDVQQSCEWDLLTKRECYTSKSWMSDT
jgi:hypothetical protein